VRPLSRIHAKAFLAAMSLLAIAGCSSGGGGPTGTAGSGGNQGQAGASGGSSGGTSGTGTAGTQAAGGRGGGAGGSTATGTGGTSAGGAGGAGTAGTSGTAGQTGTGGGAAGRGGASGAGGVAGGAGGRGGTTGSGGSAGGSGGNSPDGGMANPVTPTMPSAGRYRFAFGDVVLEIDAMTGARVGTLTLGGANVIVPSTAAARVDGGMDNTTWGSVFWTSPRSAWTPVTWPPPPAIDNAPYTTGGISGTHVVLSGPTDTSIGVFMKKDVSADATSGWIKLAYTINATKALKAGPWEISRVPRGGIVFFPYTGTVTNQVPLTITQSNGILWFNDAAMTATSPNGDKLFGDGTGWTAYVLGGNLFLKRFADQPASAFPTGEGEVDVYPGNGFLEFEVEGPYTQIAASGNLNWSVEWKVVKVPSSISVAVGSTALVDFAKQQVAAP
jgi:Domain of unknown function (DUF4380)